MTALRPVRTTICAGGTLGAQDRHRRSRGRR